MVLAVCEVNASSMTKHRTPWQIGKQYQESVTAPNTGIWGKLSSERVVCAAICGLWLPDLCPSATDVDSLVWGYSAWV